MEATPAGDKLGIPESSHSIDPSNLRDYEFESSGKSQATENAVGQHGTSEENSKIEARVAMDHPPPLEGSTYYDGLPTEESDSNTQVEESIALGKPGSERRAKSRVRRLSSNRLRLPFFNGSLLMHTRPLLLIDGII